MSTPTSRLRRSLAGLTLTAIATVSLSACGSHDATTSRVSPSQSSSTPATSATEPSGSTGSPGGLPAIPLGKDGNFVIDGAPQGVTWPNDVVKQFGADSATQAYDEFWGIVLNHGVNPDALTKTSGWTATDFEGVTDNLPFTATALAAWKKAVAEVAAGHGSDPSVVAQVMPLEPYGAEPPSGYQWGTGKAVPVVLSRGFDPVTAYASTSTVDGQPVLVMRSAVRLTLGVAKTGSSAPYAFTVSVPVDVAMSRSGDGHWWVNQWQSGGDTTVSAPTLWKPVAEKLPSK